LSLVGIGPVLDEEIPWVRAQVETGSI